MSSGPEHDEWFATILDEASSGGSPRDPGAVTDPDLRADVALVARLRRVSVPRAERDRARLAIGQRLARAILSDTDEQPTVRRSMRRLRLSFPEPPADLSPPRVAPPQEPVTAPVPALRAFTRAPRSQARSCVQRRRVALGVIAASVALLALVGGLSALSVSSLPESPLYSVKRIEESTLLALPLGNVDHVSLLGSYAMRRLNEAQAESNAGHDREAASLLREYNDDMLQLVLIAAKQRSDNTDSQAVTSQIAALLQAQDSARRAASSRGDTAFSQALAASSTSITGALRANDVTLPPPAVEPTITPDSQGSDDATATPGATAVPGATATPGSGKGYGNGKGHGNGNGNNGGDSSGG